MLCASVVTTALASPVGAVGHRGSSGIVIDVEGTTDGSLPNGFVGLAFDASEVGDPLLDPAQSNLPSYLAELGQGNLRFGGQTSDLSVAWQPDPSQPLPTWATSAITPGDLTTIAQLARATGWSVDLGVNLLHYDPAAAANEVQVAGSILGSSLHDVEIGNEPEFYSLVTSPWSFTQYSTELGAYQAAIRAADPGVSFAGPDFYFTNWLKMFGADNGSRVKSLSGFTQHFYPLADCNNTVVSASDLLSQSSIASEDRTIVAAKKEADKAGIPLVLDEFNSVSCGSSSPVVAQYASALWAVHALLEAASKGVASVDVQMNPDNCQSYTPLCEPNPTAPATLQAQPIFYGMLLVRSLEGGTVLKVTNRSRMKLPPGVSDDAVRLPDGDVAVVVDNTTSTDVTQLSLTVDPTARVVSTTSLQAPSLASTSGVTLTSATPSTGTTTGLTVPSGTATIFTLAP
jgi:hypothetical protein